MRRAAVLTFLALALTACASAADSKCVAGSCRPAAVAYQPWR